MKKIGIILLTAVLITGLFPKAAMASQSSSFDQDFATYLEEASKERGFDVTKENIEASLANYDESFDNFDNVQDISDYLGDVIQADLSNISFIYEAYQLDETALTQLLSDNGEALSDYVFTYDLYEAVYFYTGAGDVESDGSLPAPDLSDIMSYLNLFGITQDELAQLENHFMSLTDLFNNPDVLQQVEDLANRAVAIAEQVGDGTPSEAQMEELVSIYNQYLSLFKLKVNAILIKGDAEIPVSLTDMMSMTEFDGIDGIKIELYDTDSKLLADMLVTSDLLESGLGGLLEGSMGEVIDVVDEVSQDQDNSAQHSTAKGAKLPKTASNYTLNVILGLSIALTGTLVYRKVRNGKIEENGETEE